MTITNRSSVADASHATLEVDAPDVERGVSAEIEDWTRANRERIAMAVATFVAVLALGVYTFGGGTIDGAASLLASTGLTLAVAVAIVAAWRRPAPFARRPFRTIAWMSVLAALAGLVAAFALRAEGWAAFATTMKRVGPTIAFATGFTGMGIATVATALGSVRARLRLRDERLARSVAAARLAALQAQVEPHFLFNTLGAIGELAEPDRPTAAALCRHLVEFLRGSLDALRARSTTVDEDMAVVAAYLRVMSTRLGARFAWSIDVPDGLRSQPLPPAMTISLVENAIKHGVEPWPGPVSIRIAVERHADGLAIVVEDTGAGLCADPTEGFGLANVRERLQLRFGGSASLSIGANAPRGTRAVVHVPFDAPPPPDAGRRR